MGEAQHHDAVSGTAKQHVTFDYAKRLSRGRCRGWESDLAVAGLAGMGVGSFLWVTWNKAYFTIPPQNSYFPEKHRIWDLGILILCNLP